MGKKREWAENLDAAIFKKFGIKTETYFDPVGSMRFVTRPTTNIPLTNEIHTFIDAWMEKYAAGEGTRPATR